MNKSKDVLRTMTFLHRFRDNITHNYSKHADSWIFVKWSNSNLKISSGVLFPSKIPMILLLQLHWATTTWSPHPLILFQLLQVAAWMYHLQEPPLRHGHASEVCQSIDCTGCRSVILNECNPNVTYNGRHVGSTAAINADNKKCLKGLIVAACFYVGISL